MPMLYDYDTWRLVHPYGHPFACVDAKAIVEAEGRSTRLASALHKVQGPSSRCVAVAWFERRKSGSGSRARPRAAAKTLWRRKSALQGTLACTVGSIHEGCEGIVAGAIGSAAGVDWALS